MSRLETFDRPVSLEGSHLPWPLKHYHGCGDPECDGPLHPGDWVKHEFRSGKGMVVAITEKELSVLWSIEPEPTTDFRNFVAPLIRRTFHPTLAPSLVSVQPMSLPHSDVFYLDYRYGSAASTQEPDPPKKWHVRVVERIRNTLRSMIQSVIDRWVKWRAPALPEDSSDDVDQNDTYRRALQSYIVKEYRVKQ